jgi:hypothetical protein
MSSAGEDAHVQKALSNDTLRRHGFLMPSDLAGY